MSFISLTIILLLTGFPAYFFARKRRHILLIILVALSLIFIGSFAGLALAHFIDGVENDQRILRAFINGFWLSVFGVISGIFWGKKTRYKATPEQ